MTEKGKLIVISGPSGAGKGTVVNTAIRGREDVCFSTSVTTRSPRPGEVDGREYFFISPERFAEMVQNDELLEHAQYVAHSYGTPRAYVEQQMEKGFNVILEIEVQGARQIREKMPEAVLLFILPPSMEELRRRLQNRGTDSAEVIEARLKRAREELKEAPLYDYVIVNDKLEEAAAEFSAILKAERCRTDNRLQFIQNF